MTNAFRQTHTENAAGLAGNLWRTRGNPSGGDDMGMRSWLSRHKPGVLLMVVLLRALLCLLVTASWLPWNAS